jgi:hypothetical protein
MLILIVPVFLLMLVLFCLDGVMSDPINKVKNFDVDKLAVKVATKQIAKEPAPLMTERDIHLPAMMRWEARLAQTVGQPEKVWMLDRKGNTITETDFTTRNWDWALKRMEEGEIPKEDKPLPSKEFPLGNGSQNFSQLGAKANSHSGYGYGGVAYADSALLPLRSQASDMATNEQVYDMFMPESSKRYVHSSDPHIKWNEGVDRKAYDGRYLEVGEAKVSPPKARTFDVVRAEISKYSPSDAKFSLLLNELMDIQLKTMSERPIDDDARAPF